MHGRLVGRVVVRSQVWVLKRLLDRHALLRVEGERAVEEVDSIGRRLGEDSREGTLLADGQSTDVISRPAGSDAVEFIECRCADNVENKIQLMAVVAAGEERSTCEHLREDAADGPDVDRFRVHLERQHDLWCAVPPRSDVFRHHADVLATLCAGRLDATGQAEVAYFQVAVGVDEQVSGLQVTMDDVRAVNGLESAEGLIDEVLVGGTSVRGSGM